MINIPNIFKPKSRNKTAPEWLRPHQADFDEQKGIHVWKVSIANIPSASYLKYLTDEEYDHIIRYRNKSDKDKHIISRGILKELAAGYLKCPFNDLNCDKNRFGKPFFTNYNHLQFNISHSTGFILFAFDFSQNPLGIDIEENNLLFNYLDIADQYFSKNEKESLSCENPAKQFFKIWTRKEALMKAIGHGLTDELFEEDVMGDQLSLHQANYRLKSFELDQKFVFSIASQTSLNELRFFEY